MAVVRSRRFVGSVGSPRKSQAPNEDLNALQVVLFIYTARRPTISSIILFGDTADFANFATKDVRSTQRLAK
jgi:hypothetical protein